MTLVKEPETWYAGLDSTYADEKNLMSKKMAIVVNYLAKKGKLLDIGCGTGELISRVADKYEGIVGVEINKSAYAVLEEKTKPYSNVEVFDNLKKAEGAYDVCTTLDVLEHIEDPLPTVKDIFALLKTGGQYIVTVPNWYDFIWTKILKRSPYHVTFHSHYGWSKILKKAGFEIVEIRSVKQPLLKSEYLAKKFPFWGMCLVLVARKR